MDTLLLQEYFRNFKKWARRPPHPGDASTKEDLTVLIEIPKSGTCYIGLALWGRQQCRSSKAIGGVGLVVGPNGSMIHQEFRGPPD